MDKQSIISCKKEILIESFFPFSTNSSTLRDYVGKAKAILADLIPDQESSFPDEAALPLFQAKIEGDLPSTLVFTLLCEGDPSMSHQIFLSKMIEQNLFPNETISFLSTEHYYFRLLNRKEKVYLCSKLEVLVKDSYHLGLVEKSLPTFIEEIRCGLSSREFAQYLLEIKKTRLRSNAILAYQKLVKFSKRFPRWVDHNFFQIFDKFLALASVKIYEKRSPKHLFRVVFSIYFLLKQIRRMERMEPQKRHVLIRFIPTTIVLPFRKKPVLGIVILVNFFHENEYFQEKNLKLLLSNISSNYQLVGNAFLQGFETQDSFKWHYVEIEKQDGTNFSKEERIRLKNQLKRECASRIEQMVPSICMIPNEEETMRNILFLNQELRQRNDPPIAMINFEMQTATHLCFTVILVRIFR